MGKYACDLKPLDTFMCSWWMKSVQIISISTIHVINETFHSTTPYLFIKDTSNHNYAISPDCPIIIMARIPDALK